jgi:YVTN family beta-propeller protein
VIWYFLEAGGILMRIAFIALWVFIASHVWAMPAMQAQKIERQGIVVEFSAENVDGKADRKTKELREGDSVRFSFNVHDNSTGVGFAGAYPAAWVHRRLETDPSDIELCKKKAQTFIGGSLFSRADLDLNSYYIITLNDNATLSVVDPLFGFGGSKLLNMIPLPSPGYDWVDTANQARLFVSIPNTNQIAQVDTTNWSVAKILNGQDKNGNYLWRNPRRMGMQPDQHYIWAAVSDGVAVFTAQPFRFLRLIKAPNDPTDIVFSDNGRYVFTANTKAGSVSIIDVGSLKIIKTIETGSKPVSLAYSKLSQSLYVSNQGDGSISIIDGQSLEKIGTVQSEPGLGMLRFTSNGRWGLIVNPETNRLSILDASQNRIVQKGLVEEGPDQIAFSDDLAYIRHRGSSTLLMVTLDDQSIGKENERIPVVDAPGGENPLGKMSLYSPALSIVKVPGANGVLIANPMDKAVYFYKEGMAAPMGQFSNYGRSPRALLAVDRSLKERRKPGIYETVAKLPEAGVYDVVYYMDSPRILHCFQMQVGSIEGNDKPRNKTAFKIQNLSSKKTLHLGQKADLKFRLLTDMDEPVNIKKSEKVEVVISATSGLWRDRMTVSLTSTGEISLQFIPPLRGFYQINFMAPGLGLILNRRQEMVFEAE